MSDHNFPDGVLGLRLLAAAAIVVGKELPAPAHPDAGLLELCAEVLDLHAKRDALWREARQMCPATIGNPAYSAKMKERERCVLDWKPLLTRIGKIPSKTGAGVYAKALVLRDGDGTAPQLAMSVAADLVNCPGLRASLWPAAVEGK